MTNAQPQTRPAAALPAAGLNILLLTPSLPYPPIWGFGIRVYQLLRELSRRHRVTLLTYAGPEDAENIEAMRQVCDAVHVVPPPRPLGGKRGAQMLSLLSPLSYQTSSLRSPAMQDAVTRLLSGQRFDLVQVESSQMAAFDFRRQGSRFTG